MEYLSQRVPQDDVEGDCAEAKTVVVAIAGTVTDLCDDDLRKVAGGPFVTNE